MSDTTIFTKVEVEHKDDCFSVASVERGNREIPWSGCMDKERGYAFLRRDARRGGGHTLFWRIACNDPSCPGRLLVRADDVMALIREAAHVG
jgi:hypothetical protein